MDKPLGVDPQSRFTLSKFARWIAWSLVAMVVLGAAATLIGLLNSSDPSGAGMVLFVIPLIAMEYPWIFIPPIILVSYGVFRGARQSLTSFPVLLLKWSFAGLALFIVLLLVTVTFAIR